MFGSRQAELVEMQDSGVHKAKTKKLSKEFELERSVTA